MNTRNTLRAVRIDTHRVIPITFEPVASRCTGACEGEACNCLRPKHLGPAEAASELLVDPPSFTQPEARTFWRFYVALLLAVAGLSTAGALGWLR